MNRFPHNWPPPYTIRKSARSKRMTLRISPDKGLEIIVPTRIGKQRAIEFLNQKYAWVQKHWHLLKPTEVSEVLPDTLFLQAINETWSIKYGQRSLTKKLFCSEATKTILIREEKSTALPALIKEWLREKAKKHLSAMLGHYSEKYGLPYQSVNVRFQRSRWGSCSKSKNISLNGKLMLLPSELTHYIIVHELVHTVHFDHSPAFWSAVEKWVPNLAVIRNQLKNIQAQLPACLR